MTSQQLTSSIHLERNGKWLQCVAVWIGMVHVLLLAHSAVVHSPVEDEVGHVVAGLAHWESGRFDLYAVNPPLVRMLATLPVWMSGVTAPPSVPMSLAERQEFELGRTFLRSHSTDFLWWFAVARWTVIPFSILGALICYRWAAALGGDFAGLIALSLWCFDPNVLGNAALVTPDIGATAVGAAAVYAFERWLRTPSWARVLASGVMLGIAVLCKATWLALFVIWPCLWLSLVVLRRANRRGAFVPELAQLLLILAVALAMLHSAYRLIGARPASSQGFTGSQPAESLPAGMEMPGTRTANNVTRLVLTAILPAEYLRGVEHQRSLFEQGEWSYLNGEWRRGGWWYYYAYALAVKTPVGSLLLTVVAAAGLLGQRACRIDFLSAAVLFTHLACLFLLVSLHTGININTRYVLPCHPFAFILTGAALSRAAAGVDCRCCLILVTLASSCLSSLSVHPHSLAYFNEFVGGPRWGHKHLLHNNLDWGQDLLLLREWIRRRPEVSAIGVVCPDGVDPQLVGIHSFLPYRGVDPRSPLASPARGWYAIGVNTLYADDRRLDWIRSLKPVDRVGYTIWIFHFDTQTDPQPDSSVSRKDSAIN